MAVSAEWTAKLAEAGLRTAYMMRFDFESGPVFVWTGGAYAVTAINPADPLMNGQVFQPCVSGDNGVTVQFSDNTDSYEGSGPLTITLAVSDPAPDVLAEAQIHPDDYLARRFVMWRALLFTPPGIASPATWIYQRTRYGSMDELRVVRAPNQAIFELTIESHLARMSSASRSTWLDQTKFDPNDLSQQYASSAASGAPGQAAQNASYAGNYGGGGGGGGNPYSGYTDYV